MLSVGRPHLPPQTAWSTGQAGTRLLEAGQVPWHLRNADPPPAVRPVSLTLGPAGALSQLPNFDNRPAFGTLQQATPAWQQQWVQAQQTEQAHLAAQLLAMHQREQFLAEQAHDALMPARLSLDRDTAQLHATRAEMARSLPASATRPAPSWAACCWNKSARTGPSSRTLSNQQSQPSTRRR